MKVLIYYDKKQLKPVGGPSGYLYNLYSELIKSNIDYVNFINYNDTDKTKNHYIYNFFKQCYLKIVPKKIKELLGLYEKSMRKRIFSSDKKIAKIDISKYDIVHFHSTLDMYLAKDSLENYGGKVILTSHSPKVGYKEMLDYLTTPRKYLKKRNYFDKYEIIDEYAFNRADWIIFPTPEAEECYYNTWDKYKLIKEKNKEKYLYLPTGINAVKIFESKTAVRKKYNIPDDAFVISYVGRHNEIKGYKDLLVIGEKVLSKYKNVYFLIGGVEEPIKGLNDKRWIEVGWTDKPHDLINASDLFILPNKETYFDLVFLEVLSTGKTMLVTNTGGNKYFKKFKNTGIFYYEYQDYNSVLENLDNIMHSNIEKFEKNNKALFKDNFTSAVFAQNYLNILKKIGDNKNEKI